MLGELNVPQQIIRFLIRRQNFILIELQKELKSTQNNLSSEWQRKTDKFGRDKSAQTNSSGRTGEEDLPRHPFLSQTNSSGAFLLNVPRFLTVVLIFFAVAESSDTSSPDALINVIG
jgi:hypothetical protein